MGRKPREHVPGAFYHVIARGNDRGAIFFEEDDRLRFLEFLERFSRLLEVPVHGYCLMTNHVHLIVQMLGHSVSVLTHRLLGQYSRWSNRQRERGGHLFEQRHRSIRVKSDRQLLALLRYVHRNPVRAGLVEDVGAYRWSSHEVFLGLEESSWVETSACLGLLATDLQLQRQRYRDLVVNSVDDESLRLVPHIGSTRLIDQQETEAIENRWAAVARPAAISHEIDEVLRAVEMVMGVDFKSLSGVDQSRTVTLARAIATEVVRGQQTTTMSELAGILNRDVSTLSRAATAIRRRRLEDTELARVFQAISGELASPSD